MSYPNNSVPATCKSSPSSATARATPLPKSSGSSSAHVAKPAKIYHPLQTVADQTIAERRGQRVPDIATGELTANVDVGQTKYYNASKRNGMVGPKGGSDNHFVGGKVMGQGTTFHVHDMRTAGFGSGTAPESGGGSSTASNQARNPNVSGGKRTHFDLSPNKELKIAAVSHHDNSNHSRNANNRDGNKPEDIGTSGKKKPSRGCTPILDFTYRNIYTTATNTTDQGNGSGKAILGSATGVPGNCGFM